MHAQGEFRPYQDERNEPGVAEAGSVRNVEISKTYRQRIWLCTKLYTKKYKKILTNTKDGLYQSYIKPSFLLYLCYQK